jgi:hypothetical protein
MRLRQIVAELGKRGIRTMRGGAWWSSSSGPARSKPPRSSAPIQSTRPWPRFLLVFASRNGSRRLSNRLFHFMTT